MRTRSGIARRLAAIYLVVAIPLALVIAVVYQQWYDARVSQVELERAGRADQVEVAFRLLIGDMLRTMRTEGQRLVVLDLDTESAAQELGRFQSAFPFSYVAFTDGAGHVTAASDTSLIGRNLSGEPAFTSSLVNAGGDGIEPSARHDDDRVGFHIGTRIEDPQGGVLGVVLAFVDVGELPSHLDEVLEVNLGGVSIVDSQGQVVYQNEDPQLAIQMTDWGDAYPWVRQALAGNTGITDDWRFPTDGRRRIGVFVPVRGMGWAAGSSVDFDRAFAPLYRSLLLGLPLTMLVIVTALLAGYVIASRISTALKALSEDARGIGLGSLDVPVRTKRKDEIGEVAVSLEEARVNLKRQREVTASLLRSAEVLAGWTNLEEVLGRLAEVLAASLGGPRSSIFISSALRPEIRLAASSGRRAMRPGTVYRLTELSAPTRAMLVDRRTAIVDYDMVPENELGVGRSLDMHVALLVPITRGATLLGLIGVDEPGSRREFAPDEIHLVEGIATQTAVAVENGRLYDAERDRASRLEALREIASLVTSSLRSADVVESGLSSVQRHRGVVASTVWRLDERGERLVLLGSLGFPEEFAQDFAEGVPLSSRLEIARAVRARAPVVHEDAAVGNVSKTVRDAYARYEIGLGSLVALPLIAHGRVIGALTEAWSHPRTFDPDELAFATSLANTFATALENAQLYEQTREAVRLGDALSRVDDVVHSTLRAQEVLAQVLAVAAEGLGCDSSALDLIEDGAWVPRYVWNLPEDMLGQRFKAEDIPFASIASMTRKPVAVDDALSDPRASREVQERWGIPSVLVTPLAKRDELVGALFFNYHAPHRFSKVEVDFAVKVASSVSLALENAALYENEHFVAETLQEMLLALPERIPGLEFDHAYHSASEVARVGGDFFDLFDLDEGRIGITVGDISGKGVEASMLTSLVKNTIRAQATEGIHTPADVVRLANNVMLKWSPAEMFATVFFGVYDTETTELSYCNAGHTTGAIVRTRADREVEHLEANSPLVGALPGLEFATSSARLDRGDLLFLYTDGLTEARSPDGELYDESRLFALLPAMHGQPPGEVIRTVTAEVVAFGGGHLSDDLAILALRSDES